MKRNKLFIAGLVTVFVALCSLTLVSSTWAKYTSTATGEDSARVAKWEWKYDGSTSDEQVITVANHTFDLFNTINDTDGNSETDVKQDGTNVAVIAPGTQGSFEFTLQNTSEVTGCYGLDYTITNTNNIPLLFSVDGGYTWTTELADVAASNETQLAVGSAAKSFEIMWKWVFDEEATNAPNDFQNNDTNDTILGNGGSAKITVKLVITMTQVD